MMVSHRLSSASIFFHFKTLTVAANVWTVAVSVKVAVKSLTGAGKASHVAANVLTVASKASNVTMNASL